LLDRRQSDGLGQVTFPGTSGPKTERLPSDKGGCCEIEEQTATHLLVEAKVIIIAQSLWIAKRRLFLPPL